MPYNSEPECTEKEMGLASETEKWDWDKIGLTHNAVNGTGTQWD